MEGLNKVMLLGNLGADPELRVTQQGTAVLKLRLATTETYLDSNNVRQERTEWHQVTMWGKRGEALGRILKKGERIFVEGGLRTTSYEKNGEKRYTTEINATNIILSSSGGTREGEKSERREPPREHRSKGGRGADPMYAQEEHGGDDEIPF